MCVHVQKAEATRSAEAPAPSSENTELLKVQMTAHTHSVFGCMSMLLSLCLSVSTCLSACPSVAWSDLYLLPVCAPVCLCHFLSDCLSGGASVCPYHCQQGCVCFRCTECLCVWLYRKWRLCESRFRVSRLRSPSYRLTGRSCNGKLRLRWATILRSLSVQRYWEQLITVLTLLTCHSASLSTLSPLRRVPSAKQNRPNSVSWSRDYHHRQQKYRDYRSLFLTDTHINSLCFPNRYFLPVFRTLVFNY